MTPILNKQLPPHPLGRTAHARPKARKLDYPSCRGGSVHFDGAGYVEEYSPDHPRAPLSGYMRQHRLVAECHLGRLLEKQEVVHHKNEKRHDNRWCNLKVMSPHAHTIEHCLAQLDEKDVRRALRNRTTLEAARHLGVHPQTLRNRFEHLLKKRRSPGGEFPPDVVARVRQLAQDPTIGIREASRQIGMSPLTMRTCRQMHNIAWIDAPRGRPKNRH